MKQKLETIKSLNFKENINKFIDYLKKGQYFTFKCLKCDYNETHQLNYCPKCGGRMKLSKQSEYDHFINLHFNSKSSFTYKNRYEGLFLKSKRIDFSEWHKIVDIIKKTGD